MIILITKENGLPIITSINDMVRNIGYCFSWHVFPCHAYIKNEHRFQLKYEPVPNYPRQLSNYQALLEDVIVIKYQKFKYLQVRREDEAKNHKKKLLQNP
jgi:hypothetical protein